MKKFEKISYKIKTDSKQEDSYVFSDDDTSDKPKNGKIVQDNHDKVNENVLLLTNEVKNIDLKNDNYQNRKRGYEKFNDDKNDKDDFYNSSKHVNDNIKNHVLRNGKNNHMDRNHKNKKTQDNTNKKFDDRRKFRHDKRNTNKNNYHDNSSEVSHDTIDEELDSLENSKNSHSRRWRDERYDNKNDKKRKDEKNNKGRKIRIEEVEDTKHSFSIVNKIKKPNTSNNPLFPDGSYIAGVKPNGRIRSLRHLWCPKNMPLIELSIELDIGNDKIVRCHQAPRENDVMNNFPAINLLPNHRIKLHVSSKMLIIEKFIRSDNVELVNTRIPYVDKRDGTLRMETKSKLNVTKVIITPEHIHTVDIYGPMIQMFSARYSKGEVEPDKEPFTDDKQSYQYTELIDKNVDLSDDNTEEKAPYYLGVKTFDVVWDGDDISSIDSDLSVKEIYIYPSLIALRRLNFSND